MDRGERWSLILACGFWAFVGAFIALEISERFQWGEYFWGLGAIVGGLICYITDDLAGLCSGVRLAYRHTIGWRPNWLFWKMMLLLYVAFSVLFFNFVLISIPVFGWEGSLVFWVMIQFLISLFIILYGMDETTRKKEYDAYTRFQVLHKDIKASKEIILIANPVAVWFYWLPRGIWYLARRVPAAAVRAVMLFCSASVRAARAFALFVATSFRYVHSHRRTIRLAGAAIGAAVGYHAGSAVIGAIAGMIVAAVEYDLVAIRWLKVVPNGNRA